MYTPDQLPLEDGEKESNAWESPAVHHLPLGDGFISGYFWMHRGLFRCRLSGVILTVM